MIAVDTNILVYAHRQDSAFHKIAARVIRELAEGTSTWAIPWPCIHEFIAIVTQPKIWKDPTMGERAIEQVRSWLAAPTVLVLAESEHHLDLLADLMAHEQVVGATIHDARVAALCIGHGARELWTADRDFSRFPQLRTRNPLAA